MPFARSFSWLLTILALLVPTAMLGDTKGPDCETSETADEVGAKVVFRHFI
ncbi:MAG: hypothetical protein Q7T93_16555 [Methylobacterium sp.]|uniref:hypothetical protein n=1 Tax=Methylobacterium sp. TaxID=409 RepID=UPI002718A761|nr:hypothetical protein [Methylobacterium sp.]MDO9428429.1 hypothetical protein [Methylobacterium sp.]